jgi:hypothetical protein
VTFASTGKTGTKINFFKAPRVNTGRVFYQDDQLNIIFGIIHGAFRDKLRGAGVLRAYVPGSRSHQIEKKDFVVVPGEALRYASVERPDWVRIGALPAAPAATILTQGAAPAPVVLSTETPARATQPAARTYAPTSPSPATQGTAPATGTAVSSTASPSRAPVPSTGYGPGAQHYQSIEDQLRGLKKLRDQGLISEREYQAKRREIVDKL